MKKIVLAFPSVDAMAAFVLEGKIAKVEINKVNFTLTGDIPDEYIQIAISQYGASIPMTPDFISGDAEPKA